MTTYAWGGWGVSHFQMRIVPNGRVFSSPLTKQTQAIDLLGERWYGVIDIVPTIDDIEAGAREAFFDRLKGPANLFNIWNIKRPVPNGTMRDGVAAQWKNNAAANANWLNNVSAAATWLAGQPALRQTMLQFSNTAVLSAVIGVTLRAGDGFGLGGQYFRVMADATADGVGKLTVEVQPRARADIAVGSAVTWNTPTLPVMLKSDGVPVAYVPGRLTEGSSLEFIEA